MSDVPWLTLLIVVPLVGALVVPFVPRRGALPQQVGLGFAVVTLLATPPSASTASAC